jgi:hypothetical protein
LLLNLIAFYRSQVELLAGWLGYINGQNLQAVPILLHHGPGETEAGEPDSEKYILALLQADEATFAKLSPVTQELLSPARKWMQRALNDGMPPEEVIETVLQDLRKRINPNSMEMATAMAKRRGVLK